MHRPFRFGVQLSRLPAREWRAGARRIESLGFASVLWPDHWGEQWEPLTALAAVAGATERLHLGTLVLGVDYRHPVVMAKSAATLHLVSGGRHEFGLGAGWMRSDYEQAGLAYDPPSVRIERLDEALRIIRSMWTQQTTSFEGRYYRIREIDRAAELPEGECPRILVGGGGRKVLRLAGRHADIVGVNPSLHEGRITSRTAADLAPEEARRKIEWVREGAEEAGRRLEDLELNSLVFVVAVTDDPKPVREMISKQTGMSVEQVADCPLFLTGSPSEIRERLERRREELGVSYVVIQARDPELLEHFAEAVVSPLSGR
jgi:probable F420-dependent oxidoreductase